MPVGKKSLLFRMVRWGRSDQVALICKAKRRESCGNGIGVRNGFAAKPWDALSARKGVELTRSTPTAAFALLRSALRRRARELATSRRRASVLSR